MQNICLFTTFLIKKFIFFVVLTEILFIANFFHTQIIPLPRFLYKSSYLGIYLIRDCLKVMFQKTILCISKHTLNVFKYKSDFFFLLLCYKIKHKKIICNIWFECILTGLLRKLFFHNIKKKIRTNINILYLAKEINKASFFFAKLNFYLLTIENNKKNINSSIEKSEMIAFLNFIKKILNNCQYLCMKKRLTFLNQTFQIVDRCIKKKYKNIKNILKEKNLHYELNALFSKKIVLLKKNFYKKTLPAYFVKIFFFITNNIDLDQAKLFYAKCVKILREDRAYHLKICTYLQFIRLVFKKIFSCFYKDIILLSNAVDQSNWVIHLFTKLLIKIINVKYNKFCKNMMLYNIDYIFLQKKKYFIKRQIFFLKNILSYDKKSKKLLLDFLKMKCFAKFEVKNVFIFLNKNNIFKNKLCGVFFFPKGFLKYYYKKDYYFTETEKKILFLDFCLYSLILNAQIRSSKEKIYMLTTLSICIRIENVEILSFLVYFVVVMKIITNIFKYGNPNDYTNKDHMTSSLNAVIFEKSYLKLSVSLYTIINYFVNKFGIIVVYSLIGIVLILKQKQSRLGFVFCQFQISGMEKKITYHHNSSNCLLHIVNIFLKEKNKLFYKKKKKKIYTAIKLLKENLPANSFIIKNFFY